jgi:hypothetical protein
MPEFFSESIRSDILQLILIDWFDLIDWCWMPTLAVFQLYRDIQLILNTGNVIFIKPKINHPQALLTPVSSTNKTDCHDLTEILLKLPLSKIKCKSILSHASIYILLYYMK